MTLRTIPGFVTVLLVAALLVQSAPATAQQGRSTIGFVDIKRLLERAKAAQNIRTQVQKMSKALSDDVRRARTKWRKEEQDLGAKRAILSPERFAQIRRQLGQKVQLEQRALESRRVQIDRSVNVAMGKVQTVFGEIAIEIAKERSIAVLFRRASAILVPNSLDITPEVLKRLDQRLPGVVVTLPAPGKSKGGQRR